MILSHKVLLCAAVAACNILALERGQAQAATASNFVTINYKESFENPLPVSGVINLAGTGDMEAFIPFETLTCRACCQRMVVEAMLGGTPAAFPERYAQASAIKMLPIGTPQVLIWGDRDNICPLSVGEAYTKAAQEAGDPVLLVVFPGLGHFEIVSPLSSTWPVVRSTIESLLGSKP